MSMMHKLFDLCRKYSGRAPARYIVVKTDPGRTVYGGRVTIVSGGSKQPLYSQEDAEGVAQKQVRDHPTCTFDVARVV